jgi:putative DNA primase/helicase
MSHSPMEAAALKYAARGMAVFPVHSVVEGICSCGQSDCASAGKHPRNQNGARGASCDPEEIRRWWTRWPVANIGMATGAASGRFVVDVDRRHGGHESLARLVYEHGPLPETISVRTGDGTHFHFSTVDGATFKNTVSAIGAGIDVRAEGGYVILPPSVHASGKLYEWADSGAQLLSPPEWLTELLVQAEQKKSGDVDRPGGKIGEGARRTDALARAGAMRRQGFSADAIFAALIADNSERYDPPLPETELRALAGDVARRYEPAAQEIPGRVLITEKSNAERLLEKHAPDLRFAADRGIWVRWNGKCWAANDAGGALRLTSEACRGIYSEAGAAADEKTRTLLGDWARRSEGRRVLENSLALARFDRRVEVSKFSELFDRREMHINASNGTIDLNSGTLAAHRREDFLTKILDVAYDPAAHCPRFEKFLADTFADPEIIDYVQKFCGLCLTGRTSEQSWWLFHGVTASGKSTLISILRGILGPYAYALPENYFLVSNGSGDFATANLAGIRFATCVETNEGRMLDVAKLKVLTGEDTISAALKYQNFFNFRPQMKLVLATNHPPRIPTSDAAIWRRVKVLPFRTTVPDAKRIANLASLLVEEEGPGILRWAVEGCQQWLTDGLKETAGIKSAVSDYRRAEDVVADFVSECCSSDEEGRTPRGALLTAFADWAKKNGASALSGKKLASELQRLGVQKSKFDERRLWAVRLR